MSNLKNEVKEMLFTMRSTDAKSSITIESATQNDFNEFESKFQIKLPDELKEWLMLCNGAPLQPGDVYGINSPNSSLNISNFYKIFTEWPLLKWIPLASDGCGDYYVLDTQLRINNMSPIYFIDQEDYDSPAYIVASNTWSFFYFLFLDEINDNKGGNNFWPFEKCKVIERDPAILKFKNIPLPWD